MIRRFAFIVISMILWQLGSSFSLARTAKPINPELMDKFPPSPLEINPPDPLLPPSAKKQPLTPEEQTTLATELDKLDQAALVTLQAGDRDTAFEIWFRELRLRRYLGNLAEIQALAKVGAIAYNESAHAETHYITARLQAIQKQLSTNKSGDLDLWRSLGDAYAQVREPKLALEADQQVLTLVRQEQDKQGEVETLNKIAELHLSWFDYTQAAATYQELLKLDQIQSDQTQTLTYLKQLAYIYTQAKLPETANQVWEKLVKIHSDSGNLGLVPPCKLAIAANYESLAQKNPELLVKALNTYQDAFTIAWEQQEYDYASDALNKLITIYRLQKQMDSALTTSQILLETEKLAHNHYGLMETYDQIGDIYLAQKDYSQALSYFQQGLGIAQELKYNETHFNQKIAKLRSQRN